MLQSGQWQDLRARIVSGVAMAAVGIAAIWLGGIWFTMLVALVCAVMTWELARMIAREQQGVAQALAAICGVVILASRMIPDIATAGAIALLCIAGLASLKQNRLIWLVFSVLIATAGVGLAGFREAYGIVWFVWLILVVVATDVFGYFAGRMIGGPKFWPAVSPKKTWSGTVAGWIAAALIGLLFRQFTNAGVDLPWISVALSMSSQAGDMAQSAVKRRMGVKDSSSLLPGHGGLWDRFDGLLAAALFMLLVAQLVYVPEVRF